MTPEERKEAVAMLRGRAKDERACGWSADARGDAWTARKHSDNWRLLTLAADELERKATDETP